MNLREVERADAHVWDAVASGLMVEVARRVVVPLERWVSLSDHERRWLEVYAAGRISRGAVLVGRSAARLLGMWVVPLAPETIELTLRGRGSSPLRAGDGRHTFRRSGLVEGEVDTAEGVAVSTPVRTFADIARYHGFLEGLVAADWLRRNAVSFADIRSAVASMGRVKGIATVRRCVEHSVAVSDSPYESLARGLLIQAGIGPIRVQHPISGFRADILVEDWLIIEIDGAVKYRGPEAERTRQREFNRQKRIANAGYYFLRYSPAVIEHSPGEFIAEVQQTLASRRLFRAK